MPARGRGGIVYHSLVEFLSDEKWHSYEAALRVGTQACPPGLAIRTAERQRELAWRREHPGEPLQPRKKNHDIDFLMRVGGRAFAKKVMRGPSFERDPEKGLVRLSPDRKYQVNNTGKHMLHEFRPKPPPLTPEQEVEQRKERARQAYRARLINRGIDPDAPRKYELRQKAREEWAALSEEEKAKARAERATRSAATRRQKREADAQIPSVHRHPGSEGDPGHAAGPGDRPGDPGEGDSRS